MHEADFDRTVLSPAPSTTRALSRVALALEGLGEGVTLHDAHGHLIHANPWARRELALHELDVDEQQRCRTGKGELFVSRIGHSLRYDELPFRVLARPQAAQRLELDLGLWSSHLPAPRRMRAVCLRQTDVEGGEDTLLTLWMERDARADEAEVLRSIAAHELRTPLTALQLTLHTLGDKLSREPRVGAWVGDKLALARGQCRRMGRLIDRLLDPAHSNDYDGPLELERCDVADVVREVALQQADKLLRAGCELQLVLSPAPALVDRVRLEEVVENLLGNACKYARGARVEVRVEQRGDSVQLVVRDNGPGIPEQEQERVFSRFGRAASVGQKPGLGLGLYLVRRIAQAHGGNAVLEGVPEGGAQFVIQFPLAPPSAQLTAGPWAELSP